MATYKIKGVVVPLYDTLGTDALRFIINQCELKTVICDSSLKAKGNFVKYVVQIKTNIVTMTVYFVMEKSCYALQQAKQQCFVD